jgi:hypothetical protein
MNVQAKPDIGWATKSSSFRAHSFGAAGGGAPGAYRLRAAAAAFAADLPKLQ